MAGIILKTGNRKTIVSKWLIRMVARELFGPNATTEFDKAPSKNSRKVKKTSSKAKKKAAKPAKKKIVHKGR
jgi:hypothetical protein